jgi:tetratricopeptide (TPR) repeat protein
VYIPPLLTRLELFLRQRELSPLTVAKATHYSRQHVLRARMGKIGATRKFIRAMVAACSGLTRTRVSADTLFERGDLLLASQHERLSRLFREELRLLDEFLGEIGGEAWVQRVLDAGIESETAIRRLLDHGEPLIDRAPQDAAVVYHAAAAMAAKLTATPSDLAASLQGHALKGRANALRHLGDFHAALTDLTLASRLFTKAKYCVNEAGQTEYTRGTVLFKMEQWDEAETAARTARARFVATADTRRAAHADILRAGILFDRGDVDAARDIWSRIMVVLADLEDDEALARVWQNVGACEIRLGHAEKARQWLTWASAWFRAKGNRTELARTRWNIASYVATFRSVQHGIRLLHAAEEEFATLGAFADAACVGLDAVEFMLQGGTPDAALTRYARHLAGVLVQAGLHVSSAEAIDKLRRIAQAHNRRAIVRDVRTALREMELPCRPVALHAEAGGAPGPPRPLAVRHGNPTVENDGG